MKENEISEKDKNCQTENKNELTLEKAKQLLGIDDNNKLISDENLMAIISSIQLFCKVAYELYSEEQNQKVIKENNGTIIELNAFEELKEAA
jgi:hypothetical protein